MKNQSVKNNIDWISVIIYATLVVLGWLNIYSSSLLSTDGTYEKQLIFIACTIPLIFIVLFV
ncbi:MAG: rod shape-determining protein RodA, partial [Flavobacterium sp.]